MQKVLTIAGSDCSGGAGIQADIKTITCHGQYAMSVITSLTAQNTLGVVAIEDCAPEFVGQQLDSVFTDIAPDAVKIGMVSNAAIIQVIAKKLQLYKAKNIVIDPVMISTSGSKLLSSEAVNALCALLLPLADIITPNLAEAEVLSGVTIVNKTEMSYAAKILANKYSGAILIKGGHLADTADDLLLVNNIEYWNNAERSANVNTHGTGCTLSSAIACNLAQGETLQQAVRNAKEYVLGAINANLNLGKGHGPLNHMFALK